MMIENVIMNDGTFGFYVACIYLEENGEIDVNGRMSNYFRNLEALYKAHPLALTMEEAKKTIYDFYKLI